MKFSRFLIKKKKQTTPLKPMAEASDVDSGNALTEEKDISLENEPTADSAGIDGENDAEKESDSGEESMAEEIAKKDKESWIEKLHIKVLDLYIVRKFLGTYILACCLFLAVIAMFDVTEKLDAFLTAPFSETLFDYFLSFLPYFGLQLSPLFVFITVIFFTSKMASNSEIIAILSSGVSFRRLLMPYMASAAIIAAATFVLSNYIVPPTNVKRIAYTNKYVKNKKVEAGVNIQMQVEPGVVAFIGRFDNPTKTGYRFSLDKFEGKKLISRLTAQTIIYDSLKTFHWQVQDYMIRDFDGMYEHIETGRRLDTIIALEPRDFLISSQDQEAMSTPEITEFVRKQRMRGAANVTKFEIEKERRYASTGAAFILTLIGMSLASRKIKGGMGLNIGIGLALSFSYILFSSITSSLAISGLTSAFVAMWIPNVVYLTIGIFLYLKAAR